MNGLLGKTRPLLVISLSYLFALTFSHFLPIFFSIVSIGILLVLSVIAFVLLKNSIFFISFLSAASACVVFVCKFYMKDIFFNSLYNKDITITGFITELPDYSENFCRYIIEVENVEEIRNVKVPKFRIELTSSLPIDADIFQRFKVEVRISKELSLKKYASMRSSGIYLSGYLVPYSNIEILDNHSKNIKYYILLVKQKLIEKINATFEPQCASLLKAMWLGDKKSLGKETIENFYSSGLSNLLAVSVPSFVEFLRNLLKILKIRAKISYIICIVFVPILMCIAGVTPSAVRSGIVIFIYLLGMILFHREDRLNSIGIALLILILFNPSSCLDIGLWLSFVSAFATIVYSEMTKNKYRSPFFLSIVTTICTFPIVSWYFRKISIISPITNFIIIFQVPVFITLGLISIIFTFNFFPILTNFFSKMILNTVEFLGPYSVINLDFPFINIWVASTLILIFYSLIFTRFEKNIFKICLTSLNLLLIGIISYQLSLRDVMSFTIKSKSLIVSQNKKNIIFSQSEDFEKIKNFVKNSEIIFNIGTQCGNFPKDKLVMLNENLIFYKLLRDNFKAFIFRIRGKIWIKFKIFKTEILVCYQGSDAEYLPENLRKCDILIAFKLPNNFNLIKFKKIILAMNFNFLQINNQKVSRLDHFLGDNLVIDINLKNGRNIVKRKI